MRQPHQGLEAAPFDSVGPAWSSVVRYLRDASGGAREQAARTLDGALDREGMGGVNGALADVCTALLEEVTCEPGTVDLQQAVETLAARVVEVTGADDASLQRRLGSLIVYLGSDGLPCAARTEVASWVPLDRMHTLVALAIGLTGVVALREGRPMADLLESLAPSGPARAASGTFGLAWRGPAGNPAVFDGLLPRGYTARMTFLGSCSLRAVFARVAGRRDLSPAVPLPPPAVAREPGAGDR